MHHIARAPIKPAAASLAISLTTIALAACGGSSKSADTATTAATTKAPPATSTARATAAGSATSGSTGTSKAARAGAGKAVKTVTPPRSTPSAPAVTRRARTAFAQALARFASCMRANGVNLPAPNTSGKGPLLNIKGIDTKSPKVIAARTRCIPQLKSALTAVKPTRASSQSR